MLIGSDTDSESRITDKASISLSSISMKILVLILTLFFWISASFGYEVDSLKAKARDGDADSAYQLGLHYSGESSHEQNWDYAVYWFYHASLKGHQKAQVALSLLMKQGLGLPKNEEESRRWLNKAANSGFTPAQVRIAEALERGDGTPQDMKKAITWYTQAAEKGDPEAQTVLCRFYELGEGVEKDLPTAMRLCRIAAVNGYPSAQYHLGRLYLERFRDPGDFKKSLNWMHKAADQGYLDAQTHLATFYKEGIGVKRDYATAKHLLMDAAAQGDARAAHELGNLILSYGPQTVQSNKEAYDWLQISAEAGNSNSAAQLSQHFRKGGRIQQNQALAADWSLRAKSLQPANTPAPTPREILADMGTRSKRALIKEMEPPKSTQEVEPLQEEYLQHLSGYEKTQQLRAQILKVHKLLSGLKKKGGFFALQAFRNQSLLAKTCFHTGQDDLGLHLLRSLEPEVQKFIDQNSALMALRMQVPESSMTPREMEYLHDIWTQELGLYRDQTLDALKVLLGIARIFYESERYRSALRITKACIPDEETRIHRVFWDEDYYLNRVSRELVGRPIEPPYFYDEVQALMEEILLVHPLSYKASSSY